MYSSHCLEHLHVPQEAIKNWFRILKPFGFLIVVVPSRELYEKRVTLPSRFNPDHKTLWSPMTLFKCVSDALLDDFTFESLRVLNYDYEPGHYPDGHPGGEYSIELIIRK